MLRIQESKSEIQAKSYFTRSLDRGDYYLSDQELPGVWGGRGARLLDLNGTVAKNDFFLLSENRDPRTGERLTARTKANRRIGYDFNFNPSKGVSLEYAFSNPEVVMEAATSAVESTMAIAEEKAACRVRKEGKNEDRITGNLTWALFTHLTSRPVDGIPAPFLHFHVFTFNHTFDSVEGRWKALQLGDIKADAPYYEELFHRHLSDNLRKANYKTVRRGRYVDLAHIPESLIQKFSPRAAQIERIADEREIDNAVTKSNLGAATRESKTDSYSFHELKKVWVSQLSDEDRHVFAPPTSSRPQVRQKARDAEVVSNRHSRNAVDIQGRGELSVGPVQKTKQKFPNRASQSVEITTEARNAVAFAIDHAFERESVISSQRLLEIAMQHAGLETPTEAIHKAFDAMPLIHDHSTGRSMVTTQEALRQEKGIISFAEKGRGSCVPFLVSAKCRLDTSLTAEQQKVQREVLQSCDRVMLVTGGAGTGKTHVLQSTTEAIEQTGIRVLHLSPFVTEPAISDASEVKTVQKLLCSQELQRDIRGQVMWIDEAGALGVPTMTKVLEIARQQDARVILSGDYKKHGPIERGRALRLLAQEAGLRSIGLKIVQRQQERLKSVVRCLAGGDVGLAWKRLRNLDAIHELPREQAHRLLAEQFVKKIGSGKKAIALTTTRKQQREVNRAIQTELRKRGIVKGKSRAFLQLRSRGFTMAQKLDARSYERGQVICFSRPTRGFKSGERATVLGKDPLGNVWLSGRLGPTLLKRDHADRFDVFEEASVRFAKGDQIRFTRNGKALPRPLVRRRSANHIPILRNNAVYKVAGFVPISGNIVLENGWIVRKDHGHFTHAYCETSFAAQHKSADFVFLAQCQEPSLASSKEQFYSSVTRAKRDVRIFTDDVGWLFEKVCEDGVQDSATELHRRRKHYDLTWQANTREDHANEREI